MLDSIYAFLGWTVYNGQITAFESFLALLKKLLTGQVPVGKIFATILALVQLFNAAAWKTPVKPCGDELDLTGYELAIDEEFDGDSLDETIWHNRGVGARRLGYNAASQVSVKDGNLVITGEYLDENEGTYGAGWYTGAIALNEWYSQGYYEIRCKCNKDKGFWSAFWIQAEHPYDSISAGGPGGAEIDIFEAMSADAATKKKQNTVTTTVHCNGYDDDDSKLDSFHIGSFYVDDIYDEFNTYGLKWTDEEYIFYINGIEAARVACGNGVSLVPENLIVSLEIPDELPEKITNNPDYKTQMTVDYVKVWFPAEN